MLPALQGRTSFFQVRMPPSTSSLDDTSLDLSLHSQMDGSDTSTYLSSNQYFVNLDCASTYTDVLKHARREVPVTQLLSQACYFTREERLDKHNCIASRLLNELPKTARCCSRIRYVPALHVLKTNIRFGCILEVTCVGTDADKHRHGRLDYGGWPRLPLSHR